MAVGDSAPDQLSSGPVPVGAQSWRLLGCGVYLLWPPGPRLPSPPTLGLQSLAPPLGSRVQQADWWVDGSRDWQPAVLRQEHPQDSEVVFSGA